MTAVIRICLFHEENQSLEGLSQHPMEMVGFASNLDGMYKGI